MEIRFIIELVMIIDLGWIPFKTKRLEGKFIASFHFSKGHVDNQQAFLLRYNFAKEILD